MLTVWTLHGHEGCFECSDIIGLKDAKYMFISQLEGCVQIYMVFSSNQDVDVLMEKIGVRPECHEWQESYFKSLKDACLASGAHAFEVHYTNPTIEVNILSH